MRLLVTKPTGGKVSITLLAGPNSKRVLEVASQVPLADVKSRTAEMLAKHFPPQPPPGP